MEALFEEMMRTLREARGAVDTELDMLARADILNVYPLQRLRGSAAEFAGQAEFLVVMMQDHQAEEAMVREAEELCEFFEAAEDQAASLLKPGLGTRS